MSIYWKIFRVANIIEVILVSLIISSAFYYSPTPVNDFMDILAVFFVFSIPLVTALNCIHNIFLTVFLSIKKRISNARSVLFWIMFFLFTGIIALVSFGLYTFYEPFTRPENINQHMNSRQAGILLVLLLIILNGIYILVSQVILLAKAKRNYKLAGLEIVDEIGSENA